VKRRRDHDPLVRPTKSVAAGRQTNLAPVRRLIKDFKEHVPDAAALHHEWIGDEASRHVTDIRARQNRIDDAGRRAQPKRRCAGVNSD